MTEPQPYPGDPGTEQAPPPVASPRLRRSWPGCTGVVTIARYPQGIIVARAELVDGDLDLELKPGVYNIMTDLVNATGDWVYEREVVTL